MSDLKPCPFCGGRVTEARNIDGELHDIYCLRCKALVRFTDINPKKTDTFGKTAEEWTAKWNRRANDDQGADGREDHANKDGN